MRLYCNGLHSEAIRLGPEWYCTRCHKKVKVVW